MTRIEQIEARLAAATPGPWYWRVGTEPHVGTRLIGGRGDFVMDFVRRGMRWAIVRFNVGGIMHKADSIAVPRKGQEHNASWNSTLAHPDAELIAHAPADILYLLDKVKRLEGLVKEAYWDGYTDFQPEVEWEPSWDASETRKRLEAE